MSVTNRSVREIMDNGFSSYTMHYRYEPDPNAPTNLEMWEFIHAQKEHEELADLYRVLELLAGENVDEHSDDGNGDA